MSYSDYEFYTDVYKGDIIGSEEKFLSLEKKASAYVDMITSGSITEEYAEDYRIKSAVCGICDVLCGFPDDNIIAENNDGYSVTYSKDSKAKNNLLYNTARLYLPSSLLYRGL